MRTCSGCGGILGRDCFNEWECRQAGESMQIDYTINSELMNLCKKMFDLLKYASFVHGVHRELQDELINQCKLIFPENSSNSTDDLPF